MSVTVEDVRHVARLARLQLEPEEIALFTEQLNGILAHVEELATVPDAPDHPGESDTEAAAPLRADVELVDPPRLPLSAFAVELEDGFFTVPRLAALDGGAAAEAGA